jgi:hypothetical protein
MGSMDWVEVAQPRQVTDSCEYGNETSGSISWIVENQLASQGLCSVDFISYLVGWLVGWLVSYVTSKFHTSKYFVNCVAKPYFFLIYGYIHNL